MKRTAMKDENGEFAGWFDLDRATRIGSDRTDDCCEWENLYRTAKGGYVLERDGYDGFPTVFRSLEPGQAGEWMIINGIDLRPEHTNIAAGMER